MALFTAGLFFRRSFKSCSIAPMKSRFNRLAVFLDIVLSFILLFPPLYELSLSLGLSTSPVGELVSVLYFSPLINRRLVPGEPQGLPPVAFAPCKQWLVVYQAGCGVKVSAFRAEYRKVSAIPVYAVGKLAWTVHQFRPGSPLNSIKNVTYRSVRASNNADPVSRSVSSAVVMNGIK